MITISLELSELSQVQLKALSGFILSYTERYPAEEPTDRERVKGRKDPEVVAAPLAEEITPEQAFSAPIPPVAPAVPLPACGLDSAGLPWDERIHSSSKNFTADGSWRKKRGVSDALVAEVEGQLSQLMQIPTPVVAAVPPPPPPGPTLVPAPPVETAHVEIIDGRAAYMAFIGKVSIAIQSGKLTQEETQAACVRVGVPVVEGSSSLALLAKRLDLLPQVAMDIETLLASRG